MGQYHQAKVTEYVSSDCDANEYVTISLSCLSDGNHARRTCQYCILMDLLRTSLVSLSIVTANLELSLLSDELGVAAAQDVLQIIATTGQYI